MINQFINNDIAMNVNSSFSSFLMLARTSIVEEEEEQLE